MLKSTATRHVCGGSTYSSETPNAQLRASVSLFSFFLPPVPLERCRCHRCRLPLQRTISVILLSLVLFLRVNWSVLLLGLPQKKKNASKKSIAEIERNKRTNKNNVCEEWRRITAATWYLLLFRSADAEIGDGTLLYRARRFRNAARVAPFRASTTHYFSPLSLPHSLSLHCTPTSSPSLRFRVVSLHSGRIFLSIFSSSLVLLSLCQPLVWYPTATFLGTRSSPALAHPACD